MDDPFSPEHIKRVDSHLVHRTYERWTSLAREGFRVAPSLPSGGLRKGFVLGMGGSAAGGDIIASWLADRPAIGVGVFKGQLPTEDMDDSLAIAVSASGETEETIEMMKTAVKKHATVVSISSGGSLMEVAKKLGVPHIRMPGLVAPRYVLPYIVFACLSVMNSALDLKCEADAEEAFRGMEAEGRTVRVGSPLKENPSKVLALSLVDRTPVIYGSKSTRGAGIRFKNVLNENAKVHALYYGIPDAFHNDIEAWEDPRGDFEPIFLRHSSEEKRDRVRTDLMVRILSSADRSPIEVSGRRRGTLSELITLVYRLDMASYYLALCLGRDPFPTKLIDRLKRAS
ncbi:MAG: hypothetical protein OK438_01795 [Thaumarchaeota archaeon]|nr:hypothetical protein [Nitrososphaerota archaeon]